MKQFTDNQGRSWEISITVAAIKRVRDLVGVDLLEILEGGDHAAGKKPPLISRLMGDPILLVDVLWAVCKPQAQERDVSDESFGAAMAGDSIETATTALLDELVNFCPSPRDRANLGRVLDATRRAMDRARDLIDARMDRELDGIVERAIGDQLPPTAGESSTNAPASSASTPTPSRSENSSPWPKGDGGNDGPTPAT